MDHEPFTRMLFTDAIVGVGFPHNQIGIDAERGGLATLVDDWVWDRTALEALSLETLQELYTGLKLHEVTHAHQ